MSNRSVINGFRKMSRDFDKLDKSVVKVASQVRNRIARRTRRGVDYQGSPGVKLNSKYATYKASKGRKPIRNMSFYGDMLNDMAVRKTQYGAKIYFPDAFQRKKARIHTLGEGKQPKFEFFELSTSDRNYIYNSISEEVEIITKW